MTICLCLPFVLLAEEDEDAKTEAAPDGETAATAVANDPEFQRFKTILDRMPFGQPPVGFDPDAPGGAVDGPRGAAATAEAAEAVASEVEQQILSSVSVSMLNRSPDGSVFVGFTDKSVQPPRNYLLKVGEKREGCDWLVVSANPEERQVKLSKDGVEATLKLGGGGPAEEKGKETGDAAKNVIARPGLRPGIGHRRMSSPDNPAGGGDAEGKVTGLAIARARRQERLKQQQAEAELQRQAAEQEKQEREQAQREREQAAEERKQQLAQLMQIQEELQRQREEKAEAERRAAENAQSQESNQN